MIAHERKGGKATEMGSVQFFDVAAPGEVHEEGESLPGQQDQVNGQHNQHDGPHVDADGPQVQLVELYIN